ncbi:hypothetical protein [Peristeroidobacter soli]|uniref:hypothetical protein n=1 Tax=Peristeroidobacter soli TaxID=2497877 RepID=UPI00101C3FBE|nr:hypothetical protein [Peristeroidobacter soli]
MKRPECRNNGQRGMKFRMFHRSLEMAMMFVTDLEMKVTKVFSVPFGFEWAVAGRNRIPVPGAD